MADIRHSILIDAPKERVLSLVSSAAGLSEWWAEDSSQRDAEHVDLGFFGRSTVYSLTVEFQSPDEISWRCETGDEWKDTSLRFTASTSGKATLLRFGHERWREETDYFFSCNTTWGALMYRLKRAAESKSPSPLFSRSGLNL